MALILFSGSAMFAQVGISSDNSTPAASAGLDVNFNNKGFLPPRMNTTQRNAVMSPAEGLVIYNTDQKALNVYNGTAWKYLTPGPDFTCGSTLTINHATGAVAPVNKSVTYGTVTGLPGEPLKCWITSNLGADNQATSVSDAAETAAGWYWQFNHKQGFKHDGTTRTPATAWIGSIVEPSGWIAQNDPCSIELGPSWRIPTLTEWSNVRSSGGWTNWNGPWGSGLKIHAAGSLDYSDGSLYGRGSMGQIWSSTQTDDGSSWTLTLGSSWCNTGAPPKITGLNVRCLRD